MIRGLALQLSTIALVVATYLVSPPEVAGLVAALTFLACAAFIAFVVSAPSVQWLVPTVHRGEPGRNVVAFTFDDGPDEAFTPRVLERLAAHGAKATFFVVGSRTDAHPELARRALREGHELGSHSYSHALSFHFSRARVIAKEIQDGIEAVARATGTTPRYFRPPQGLRIPTLRDALGELASPPICVTWTARGLDTMSSSSDAIVRRLAPSMKDGAILTLHDGTGLGGSRDREPTLLALEKLLVLAGEKGLRCVRLDELLQGARNEPPRGER